MILTVLLSDFLSISMAKGLTKILLTIVATLFVTTLSYAQVNPYTKQLRGEKRTVSGGMLVKIDSAAIARRDSIRITKLADSLRTLPKDSDRKSVV